MDRIEMERCWREHEDLVRWTIWRIIKRYGGDFDEYWSECLVLFVEAVRRYDERKGLLSNWLSFFLYKQLQENRRTNARHLRITGPLTQLPSSEVRKDSGFLGAMWRDLSSESQDILTILFEMDASRYRNISMLKLDLRWKVKETLSLTNEQFDRCFSEIEAAIP